MSETIDFPFHHSTSVPPSFCGHPERGQYARQSMQIQRLGDWLNGPSLNSARVRKYFPLHYVQRGSGAQPAS